MDADDVYEALTGENVHTGGINDVSEQLSHLFAKTPENKQKIVTLKYSVNFDSQ